MLGPRQHRFGTNKWQLNPAFQLNSAADRAGTSREEKEAPEMLRRAPELPESLSGNPAATWANGFKAALGEDYLLPDHERPISASVWELTVSTGSSLSLIHISEPTRPY